MSLFYKCIYIIMLMQYNSVNSINIDSNNLLLTYLTPIRQQQSQHYEQQEQPKIGYESYQRDDNLTFIYISDPLAVKRNITNNNVLLNVNKIDNPFEIIYQWKYLDFEFNTYQRRKLAISRSEYIPENNLPLGIDISSDRIFVTTPRWKDGVPASLNFLPKNPNELSPLLQPYPNLDEHGDPYNPDCNKLISVYRTQIDECGRLWCIDSGIVNATVNLNQICPPKIVAYDLNSNKRVVNYNLPPEQIKQESLHSNIIVDIRDGICNDAYAYVTDVWRYGIVVYSLARNQSWRTTNHFYYPTPEYSDFNVYGLNFQWPDGAFGMSLSPANGYKDRLLFFHPMASNKEFAVSTNILRDESLWLPGGSGAPKSVIQIGNRGLNGQSSTSGISKNQIMFFTLVHRDSVGCWDINKPYTKQNLNIIAQNDSGIVFPNDLKIDKDINQNVWIISNKLPIFLYSQLNYNEINFKIMRANINNAIKNTICNPNIPAIQNVEPEYEECF
ncbi:protein yellow-like isoform X2 [Condylostylus longicornis]|nr:protein yellow-like isoform X2 [Condylostylus longicornis]